MTVATERVLVPEAPSIPALTFRRLRLPGDLQPLVALFNVANEADEVENRSDVAGLAEWFSHPSGYNPLRDCLIAQVADAVIGYGKEPDRGHRGVRGQRVRGQSPRVELPQALLSPARCHGAPSVPPPT